ncbi:GNAT family N-acetyltransferase [Peptostreptococcus equinus]|uniref:GNAT family N-acetyltransferase n=1 Tax=Peptostreptococcus equinus TaxID=3003601 RepID=A0ABY7JR93_9FIRM|nr:GNAT family N-acetyltransferase [Peptostreptococcus sp. CBA3647]WAW14568.1 GNAT family N-acetyltransferase [Peptostreptococcus sp. CBA3647]
MEVVKKKFEELSSEELFDIFKLRESVFVVEQECPYPEIDDLDKIAMHVYLKENDEILAYIRVLPQNTSFEEAGLGRVIAAKRKHGYGAQIVKIGIDVAKEYFGADAIVLDAEEYAKGFYEKEGFVPISERFIDYGIPHVRMRLN